MLLTSKPPITHIRISLIWFFSPIAAKGAIVDDVPAHLPIGSNNVADDAKVAVEEIETSSS